MKYSETVWCLESETAKVRERLLRESNLTLGKADEICRAAESTSQQLKLVESPEASIHVVDRPPDDSERKHMKECWKCGWRHAFYKRELCPAYGKICNKCQKPNHFAVKCRQKTQQTAVKAVNEQDSGEEVYHTSALTSEADNSQLVTLKLENGNFVRFQVDTGAQCNVVPVDLYKKAANDPTLKRVYNPPRPRS